jgi:hypothetical protein
LVASVAVTFDRQVGQGQVDPHSIGCRKLPVLLKKLVL